MAKATTKEPSMTTLAEIHAKIEELKKLEAELLAKEREPIIAQLDLTNFTIREPPIEAVFYCP